MAARIHDTQNDREFEKLLADLGGGVAVVLFLTSWAEQCQQMLEVMKELSLDSEFIHVKFVTVEAEDFSELSLRYDITAVPTTLILRNAAEVDRIDGVHAAELTSKVRKYAALAVGLATTKPDQEEDLNSRLKKLIHQSPVMLFMKGSPEEPKCGFSRQTIQILADHNVKFGHFDILTDDAVRQGLKVLSDWPTYPQLYVHGELLGGLDIIKEMVANGQLTAALPQQLTLEDRLKQLVNKSHIMIFMKGSRENPKCGFSRRIVDIMKDTNLPYETFDILEDEEVRQGLKKFSDWPTYPQLYVRGELIGGLDIVTEMKANDELISALSGT